jgi:flagellar motor switch/type III secretory pathway protein FliN
MSSDLEALDPGSADRLGDITITVEAVLDRTTLSFLDVSDWSAGTLVRLPSSAGELITLEAGNVRLGTGEVLTIDGMLSIRVSDLANTPDLPDSAA